MKGLFPAWPSYPCATSPLPQCNSLRSGQHASMRAPQRSPLQAWPGPSSGASPPCARTLRVPAVRVISEPKWL
eukprot:3853870-Lingulodinium_polyedra.AAC.1